MWRICLVFIVPILFFSCAGNKKQAIKQHFNIETYLDSVFLPKLKTYSTLKKTAVNRITKDSSTITQKLDLVNLKKILAIFYQSNIDKSAYYGLYKIDTVWHKNIIAKVQYTTSRNDLKVKKFLLYFDVAETIDSIVILKKEEDFVQKSGKKLTLLPHGFNISGSYSLKQFNEKQEYSMKARFYK